MKVLRQRQTNRRTGRVWQPGKGLTMLSRAYYRGRGAGELTANCIILRSPVQRINNNNTLIITVQLMHLIWRLRMLLNSWCWRERGTVKCGHEQWADGKTDGQMSRFSYYRPVFFFYSMSLAEFTLQQSATITSPRHPWLLQVQQPKDGQSWLK